MFENSDAFSGMSSDDVAASHRFYQDVLDLVDHRPATFTILNFPVDDIDKVVDELVARGVTMQRYEGSGQDEKGIMRGKAAQQGPDIAWFTDPAGNILSVLSS